MWAGLGLAVVFVDRLGGTFGSRGQRFDRVDSLWLICCVSVVWPCPKSILEMVDAARELRPPLQRCPSCRFELRLQGGYERRIRHLGHIHRLWIWRGYCRGCDRSHALLPDTLVANHLDTVDTIYAVVELSRPVLVPASTQRGWRARYRRNRVVLASGAAATAVAVGGDPGNDWRLGHLLMVVWLAARRRTDRIPNRWRILNIISGSTWMRERVNSSWLITGTYPRPP